MNAIPWYQSKVLMGAIVSIISQVLVIVGKQDVIPVESISANVENFFQLIALGAAGYSAWTRARSNVQPVTLTQSAASNLPQQKGFAQVSTLTVLVFAGLTLVAVSACTTPPTKVIQTACEQGPNYLIERCAQSVADEYKVYQKRILEAVTDPATPKEAKDALKKLDAAASPVLIELTRANEAYVRIKNELAAGTTDAEKVAIANAALARWVPQAIERVNALIKALGG